MRAENEGLRMGEKKDKDDKDRQIAYLAKSEPLLEENYYLFSSRQTIEVRDETDVRGQDNLDETFEFEVSYRRFRLNPEEIHSSYPPAFQTGDYVNHIPQITLMEDTLPWEQEIKVPTGTNNPDEVLELPGMFLLVVKKGEGAVKQKLSPKKWEEASVYLGEKLKRSCLQYEGEQEESCLDVPVPLLKKILPDVRDLPYMAHVRWVKVEDKETRQFITEGHYSSLIANRVPVREDEDVAYEVFVVGTLGLEEYYQGQQTDFGKKEAVRLGLFYCWEFTSSGKNRESGSDFKAILDQLNTGYMGNKLERGMTKEIRRLPALEQLLRSGFRPFNTQLRSGDKTVTWYKSPLSPFRLSAKGQNEAVYGRCLSHADAGLTFLPQLGMYDVTDSAAWTLGRLLAMKNQSYLTTLFELRMRHHEKEKETWNIHMIRELLFEEAKKETDTDFAPLIAPLREQCSRLVRAAAEPEADSPDSRSRELQSLEKLITKEAYE